MIRLTARTSLHEMKMTRIMTTMDCWLLRVNLLSNYLPAAGIDESFSSLAITVIMEEGRKGRDLAPLVAFQHDVEHQWIVNLLKLLEDAQCPDYMLLMVLQPMGIQQCQVGGI
jgi:hypothetical protein